MFAARDTTHLSMITLDDGTRMLVDLSDPAIGLPIAEGRYERNELDFVRRTVREGHHVVDGGAHAGLYALSTGRIVGPRGRVIAFEPLPETATWLELGIASNGLEGIVSLERAALAASSGSGEMVLPASGHPATAFLRPSTAAVAPDQAAAEVRTVALDHLALPRPLHFIRLDVEGAEGLVLEGAVRIIRADHPVLLVEVHADRLEAVSGVTVSTLLARMRAAGYRCHALGAGTPGREVVDAPIAGVHSIVFLP